MYEIYQRLLDEKGLKNADVSRGTGISNMTLSDWKNGKSTPKADKMQKIADFLDVSVDYLITGKEKEYTVEIAETDVALSKMEERLKEYALKLSKLSKSDQENIMYMIDSMSKRRDKIWKIKRKVVVRQYFLLFLYLPF